MASIWKAKGKTETKLARGDNPEAVKTAFTSQLARYKQTGWTVDLVSGFEAMISKPGRTTFLLFIEFLAPPTAPETGQPMGTQTGGVKAANGFVYAVDIAAYAKGGLRNSKSS